MIPLGRAPLYQPGVLQHVEVIGQQVASHPHQVGQLGDGSITDAELIHNEETSVISEGGVSLCPFHPIHNLRDY